MSEKKTIITNKRKTLRNRQPKSKFIIKNMNNLVSIIETILVRNNLQSDKFKSVFDEIYHNVTVFSNQFMDIGVTKINRIETDMASIKYNRKTDIKSTLFGFIELLDDNF